MQSGEHPDLVAKLAVALLKLGEVDEAERLARRAVAPDPNGARCVHTLGAVLFQRGDVAGALRLCEQAALIDPDRAYVQVNLERALAEMGRRSEGCLAWRRASGLRVDPSHRSLIADLIDAGCR